VEKGVSSPESDLEEEAPRETALVGGCFGDVRGGLFIRRKREDGYTGEIVDIACTKMGSQDASYQRSGASMPPDCTRACVRSGRKCALMRLLKNRLQNRQFSQAPAGALVYARLYGAS
jgi:hypothetical protein